MALQAKSDFYEVLGVPRTATAAEIENAFEKLVAEFHARGKPHNIDDVEEIRAIATAYRVLSDVEKRQRYDQFGYPSIGDDGNKLASGGPDKLDRLLEWLESRRQDSGGFLVF